MKLFRGIRNAIIPSLILWAIILWAAGAWGATYSIGPGQTYETFTALVATETLTGDDIVDGGGNTFRETWTPDGSGTSGHPITLRNATVTGGSIITGFGQTWEIGESKSKALVSNLAGAWNGRSTINANTFAVDGSALRITLQAPSDATSTIAGVYIGEKAASGDAYDMEAGTISQFLFSGIGTASISASQTLESDPLTYTFDKTKIYIISVGATNLAYGAGTNYGPIYYKSNAQADAGTANVSTYSGDGSNYNWWGFQKLAVIVSSGSQANTWAAPVTTVAQHVFFDGTHGTKKASVAALTTNLDWYSDGSFLYTYRDDDVDPDTAYTTIDAAQRQYAVNVNAKDYITISNMHLTNSNSFGVSNTGTNTTVQNCQIDYLGGAESYGGYGFFSAGVSAYSTGNTYAYINGNGFGSTSAGLISDHDTYQNIWNGLQYGSGGGGTACYAGGNTAIVRYGNFYGNYVGILVTDSSDSQVYYNILDSQKVNGIDIQHGVSDHPTLVYNNTVHHNPTWDSGHGIDVQLVGNSATIYNNIVWSDFTGTNTNVELMTIAAGDYPSIGIDYNLYYLAAGSTCSIGKLVSTQYGTFADWKTALAGTAYSGKDANSLNVDPLFLSATDFRLRAGSPARDAGTSVSLTTDYLGNEVPINVLPDVGAYEWHGGAKMAVGF